MPRGEAAKPAAPRVSIIIPHYEDLANLSLCLDAIDRQTFGADNFEVIVADNGSPCGPEAVGAVIAGRARLVVVTERGAGPARNGGVAASTGTILAFTDSDCRPDPAWIAEGVAALADFDFVGGDVTVAVEDEAKLTPTEAFERVFAFNFEDYIHRKGFTGSGNLFVPRAIFDQVGGFLGGVSEDVEWSRRATSRGFRLGYAPRARVAHPARRDWAELRGKWRRINQETFLLGAGRRLARTRWLARTLLLPASAVAHVPRVLASGKLKSPGERGGAIGVLFLSRLWRLADGLRLLARR